MNIFATTYLKLRERRRYLSRGQTMTEYALIMAAIAVVVFVTYNTMGNDINSVVNGINVDLSSAS